MNDSDLNKIGEKVEEKVNKALEPVHQKLDALTADVIQLQDTAKAVWDKFSLVEEKHEHDIREIKEHLGLPPSSNS